MPPRPSPLAPAPPVRDELAAWLTRVSRDLDVVALELIAGEGEDARTVYAATWPPARDPAATMAAELRGAASAHGELQAGPVVYQLRAGAVGADSLAMTPLRVAGPHAHAPLATGAPADLVATAQRHAETAHALSMRTLAAASDAIRALATEVRERAASDQDEIRYWRERSREIREAHAEVARVQASVELERDLELERERRLSSVTEQATKLLLPALARKLTPPAQAENGSTPNVPRASAEPSALATVRAAWGHLSPETVDRIAAELPPDVAAQLVSALDTEGDS